MTIVFLDTETTGLAPDAEVWEIGMIVRAHEHSLYDGEWLWQVHPGSLAKAEPMGLRIGRFYERFVLGPNDEARCMKSPVTGEAQMNKGILAESVAHKIVCLLDGATWVGAVPSFDELRLGRFIDRNGWKLTHHYHLIDVEPLMAGYIAGVNHAVRNAAAQLKENVDLNAPAAIGFNPQPPWKSKDLTAALGVRGPEAEEHTALGDARWAMNAFDAVFGLGG